MPKPDEGMRKEEQIAASAFKKAFTPVRVERIDMTPAMFEAFIDSIKKGNVIIRSISLDEGRKPQVELDVTTAWADTKFHVHGRLTLEGDIGLDPDRRLLKLPEEK